MLKENPTNYMIEFLQMRGFKIQKNQFSDSMYCVMGKGLLDWFFHPAGIAYFSDWTITSMKRIPTLRFKVEKLSELGQFRDLANDFCKMYPGVEIRFG